MSKHLFYRSIWKEDLYSTSSTSCCLSFSSCAWICPPSWSQTEVVRRSASRSRCCWLSPWCSSFLMTFCRHRQTRSHWLVNGSRPPIFYRMQLGCYFYVHWFWDFNNAKQSSGKMHGVKMDFNFGILKIKLESFFPKWIQHTISMS